MCIRDRYQRRVHGEQKLFTYLYVHHNYNTKEHLMKKLFALFIIVGLLTAGVTFAQDKPAVDLKAKVEKKVDAKKVEVKKADEKVAVETKKADAKVKNAAKKADEKIAVETKKPGATVDKAAKKAEAKAAKAAKKADAKVKKKKKKKKKKNQPIKKQKKTTKKHNGKNRTYPNLLINKTTTHK
eukprot:TRINITY_DN24899_c0_g1_i1.p2 TRINITY_DN24899_c0_g1~~TRINITY_DN24899_c0_g1_i1.p2  ORF type:complete len:183 (+),score=60.92 TRINITY_DN24899_c0_g1_i1:185-733(+)